MHSVFRQKLLAFSALVVCLIGLAACSQPVATVTAPVDVGDPAGTDALESAGTDAADAVTPWTCQPCVQRSDCGTNWCVQYAADTYCAADCTNSPCATGLVCKLLVTESGESVKGCVPAVETCSNDGPDAESPDVVATATDAISTSTCGYDGPNTPSCCTGCGANGTCQPNGCFNGWVCSVATCKCLKEVHAGACDDASVTPDTQTPEDVPTQDAAPGTLTAAGGTVPDLSFAIVGDTRPAFIEDTKGYPSAIAKKIWQGVQSTGVAFAVTTGDYMFASPWGSQGAPQLDLYLAAASAYTGLRLPALGNHECTGATTSNCGTNGKDGLTKNYTTYLTKMLEPLGLDHPWYAFHVNAEDGSWTAKFVFVAANAWDNEQAVWLDAELAKPTTYTFVVRHEPTEANTAPGVKPSEAIIKKYPLTLRLVGHTHTYAYYPNSQEIVVGNGGAPLSGAANYGFVLVKRRPDAAIEFNGVDYSTGQIYATFAIKADGSPAP
jgi:hypothetical protein